jgi:hypothetical protein
VFEEDMDEDVEDSVEVGAGVTDELDMVCDSGPSTRIDGIQ